MNSWNVGSRSLGISCSSESSVRDTRVSSRNRTYRSLNVSRTTSSISLLVSLLAHVVPQFV